MSYRDRTKDFLLVTETVMEQPNVKAKLLAKKSKPKPSRSEFVLVAQEIGKELSTTRSKLNMLAKLAKTKSLFNDPVVQVEELRGSIAEDLRVASKKLEILEHNIARPFQTNAQTTTHSINVIFSLRKRITDMSKEFQNVLKTRTEIIKELQEKRQQFGGASSPMAKSTPFRSSPMKVGAADLQQEQVVITMSHYDDSQDRLEAVRKIEETMVELQGMFQNIAQLVAVQREKLQRIDVNISNTAANADNAQSELLKYLKSISSNRKLVIQLFVVLIVFIVIFVVFFV